MPANGVSAVVVHGAWADGSSWSKVIGPLAADGVKVSAAPLPEQDRMIVAGNQRLMAERMRARVRSHAVDHAPIVTAPAVVLDVLREAIAAVRAESAA